MLRSLFRWAHVLGALPRIVDYHERIGRLSYYEKVRFVNSALGPDWIFRLQDVVGAEEISTNRPSWLDFYRSDIYGQHLPLDPRAPETDQYLTPTLGSKEFAFYAGMGFDGYALALKTKRSVETSEFGVDFDEYSLRGVDLQTIRALAVRNIIAEDYYEFYGRALNSLYDAIVETVGSGGKISDERIENVLASCLLFLCGGHHGCKSHVSEEEGQLVRLKTIIISRYVEALARGEILLKDYPARLLQTGLAA